MTRAEKMKRQRTKAIRSFLRMWDGDHGSGRFATEQIRQAERAHDKMNFEFGWASAETAMRNIS